MSRPTRTAITRIASDHPPSTSEGKLTPSGEPRSPYRDEERRGEAHESDHCGASSREHVVAVRHPEHQQHDTGGEQGVLARKRVALHERRLLPSRRPGPTDQGLHRGVAGDQQTEPGRRETAGAPPPPPGQQSKHHHGRGDCHHRRAERADQPGGRHHRRTAMLDQPAHHLRVQRSESGVGHYSEPQRLEPRDCDNPADEHGPNAGRVECPEGAIARTNRRRQHTTTLPAG